MQTGGGKNILVLGGKPNYNLRAQTFEAPRSVGHNFFFARNVRGAFEILGLQKIDRIVIEAFMDNSEHESPFHFLREFRQSSYSEIPVLVMAAEPSRIGTVLSNCIGSAIKAYGAKYVTVLNFSPAETRLRVIQDTK